MTVQDPLPDLQAGAAAAVEALGAGSWRVTLKSFSGAPVAFVWPQKGQLITGDQLVGGAPELARQQTRRGLSVYITPIPARTAAWVLVDDLSSDGYRRLFTRGYRPALVQSTSAGNLQAVLRVALDAREARERAVLNAFFRQINKQFGDPRIAGAVHPFRLPGSLNTKHARPEGGWQKVRLLRYESRTCELATEELRQMLHADASTPSATKARRGAVTPATRQLEALEQPASPATLSALVVHLDDCLRLALAAMDGSGKLDESAVEWMACCRLRATGHTLVDVASALLCEAPRWRAVRRLENKRAPSQWAAYSIKTAREAFGPVGDKELDRLARWVSHWRKLERVARA